MLNKKLGFAGLSVLLLLVMSGCGDKPAASGSNGIQSPAVVSGAGANGENSSGNEGSNEATAEPTNNSSGANDPAPTEEAAQKQNETIKVYFTDPQLLDLVEAEVSISYTDAVSKYTEAFKGLQSSDNPELIPLWGKIELNSLKFEDGQIVMDIHKPDEAQLGAGGEAFALSALTQTLFQFPEVQSVELLVDGEQVESLMGHVDLEHPMTRDNS
ncbi:GerMN domain-containing protein [Paenibacillus sp. sgz500958]|uniref:GerMN domain-containing protein n=1 Tax=Paenibacillus sp. sgz500958 TaxID=3242475 RepID=UPI0036D42BBB